jgi:hypothetical protein
VASKVPGDGKRGNGRKVSKTPPGNAPQVKGREDGKSKPSKKGNEADDARRIVAALNPNARGVMESDAYRRWPPEMQDAFVREMHREEARQFAARILAILDGTASRSAADVHRAIECLDLARAHFAGWEAPDVVTMRTGAVIHMLDHARSMLSERSVGDNPVIQVKPSTARHEAGSIVARMQSADPFELSKIPMDAWERAIVAWPGYSRGRRGRPRGQRGQPRGRTWPQIVFELLDPYGLTNARTVDNLRDAFESAQRRP